MTLGKSEIALLPAQLTYNALDYVETNPNATERGMIGQMVGESWMYGTLMYGSSVGTKIIGETVKMNAPLLRESFPKISNFIDSLSKDTKELIPPKITTNQPKPPLVADDIAKALDDTFRNDANTLIRKAEELKLSGSEDTTQIMKLASEIRKNDLAVSKLNADENLKFIAKTNANVESQAMEEFSVKIGEKVGTEPENIVMKKWTGRKPDQFGRDFDGTTYQYIPESTELPPHLKPNPENPTGPPVRHDEFIQKLIPEGRLVGNGKYHQDFSTGEIREVVPGKYYEPAVKVNEQQQMFNDSLYKAAGSPPDVTPEQFGTDLNAKVTTRMSTDSYGYHPEQTGKAISWKIQDPVSDKSADIANSYANSHHEAAKLIDNLNAKMTKSGTDPNTIPHYDTIQKANSIIRATPEDPIATENALRAAGISTSDLGDIVGWANYWLGKVRS